MFVVDDLPQMVPIKDGDAFAVFDTVLGGIRAAEESLFEVRGPEFLRYAWHI